MCALKLACLSFVRVQEIIAILLALVTFRQQLAGRKVVLYSDNKGAEYSTKKGSAKAFDHNALIHEIWTFVVAQHIHLWIERVPSKVVHQCVFLLHALLVRYHCRQDNISDSPSRFEYDIMADIGATWVKPAMPEVQIAIQDDR